MQVGGHEASRHTVKLHAKVAQGDGFTALRLDGVIDEHNGLAHVAASLAKADVLAVDLGGVKRLNSVGVRDWVNWLREVRAKFSDVVLFDCPPPVMNEVNFVKNFAEGAYITTFAAPLYCTRCQKEESRLLETHRLLNGATGASHVGRLALPSFNCERTDCENALDDDEDSYFAFVRTLPETPSTERLARITELARKLLLTAGRPLTHAGDTAHALPHSPATRSQPLGQLGLQGVPRRPLEPPSPPPANPLGRTHDAPLGPPPAATGGDWLFIVAVVAMLGVLGVLIYLILTLE